MSHAAQRAAILIVNGGDSADADRWIRLCLERIAEFTDDSDYHLYVWNNRTGDAALDAWLLARPHLTLLEAAPYEHLNHPHRTPLQRLYHRAKADGAHYLITLDSDAHPLRAGWLRELIAAVDGGAAIAGVWRDEMPDEIQPFVHPSCLCTTVDFIEQHRLRLDFDNTHSSQTTDTLSHFSLVAQAHGLPLHGLQRSNHRQFHPVMGGIYGDLIYHHAAATRKKPLFRTTKNRGMLGQDQNRALRDHASDLLFGDYAAYMGWLQGKDVAPDFAAKMVRLGDLAREERSARWWLRRAGSAKLWSGLRERLRARIESQVQRSPLATRIRRAVSAVEHRAFPHGQERKRHNPLFTAFSHTTLPPLPAHGWVTAPPAFVGVGAPKCGTTWWYRLITSHPQVVPNRAQRHGTAAKETQFLAHHRYHALTAADVALYQAAFASPPGAICGEFSTLYLAYPTALEHLAVAAPDAKVLVILRNPIDRMISHLNHLMTRRGVRWFGNANPKQRFLLNHYSFTAEATLHSLYSIGLARLLQTMDRDRVLVLQYERMVQAPAAELARTYRFLGVDERFHVTAPEARVQPSTYVIAKPDADERRRLAGYFRADVQRVFALCPELDPTLWADFAALPATDTVSTRPPQ